MGAWTRVRFETEEVSLNAEWVASLDEVGGEVVEQDGDWRPTTRLDTPEGAVAARDYEAATVDALTGEIDARNEGRTDDDLLDKSGKKADLVAALKADDA